MTDLSQTIDPKRPWIDDPRDDPSEMKMLWTLVNPFGLSSRLHFTRGWTVLFFARVFAIIFPIAMMAVFGAAGANTEPLGVLFGLIPLTFVLTLLMSTVLHVRRLSEAGRPAALAAIVWVPVILGAAVFFALIATQTPDLTGGGQGGGWGRPQDPQTLFQGWVTGNAQSAFMAYALSLICVAVWSLTWVGRLPNGGGRIRDRVQTEA